MSRPLRLESLFCEELPTDAGVLSLVHDDHQRLVFGGSAVHHQRLSHCADTLIAREVDEIGCNNPGFAGLQRRLPRSFDFHDEASLDHVE